MVSKNKTSITAAPSSDLFEPYCEWKKEDNSSTLIIHLPDFKKDQLRVQVNNLGVLKVSGERLDNEGGTKRKTFLKETKIPQGCNINDIRAKFSGGYLHVIMPEKATPQVQEQQQKPETKSSGAPETEVISKPKASSSESGKIGTSTSYDPTKDKILGLGRSPARFQVQNKVSTSLGVAIAVIVAIGAYAAYKYGSSTPHVED